MKKYFFYAAAAMLALASCSQDETANSSSGDENEAKTAIQLGVSTASMTVGTRGTGTVGSTDATTNAWAGQIVKVFMFEKGTLDLATLEGQSIYEDAELYTPGSTHFTSGFSDASSSGIASRKDGEIKYYPLTNSYDFWGYRLDDAATGAYDKTTDATQVAVPFTIDGSQDVMTAATDNESVVTAYNAEHTDAPITDDILYSAKAARKTYTVEGNSVNIQPNLIFKHKLTRLTFSAVAGNDDAKSGYTVDATMITSDATYATQVDKDKAAAAAAGYTNKVDAGVYIDAVSVYSKVTGKLVVAYTADNAAKAQGITWDEITDEKIALGLETNAEGKYAPSGDLKVTLMQRPTTGDALTDKDGNVISGKNESVDASKLVAFTSVVPTSTTDVTTFGEALMVYPADQYRISVTMHQYKKKYEDWYVDETSTPQAWKYVPVSYETEPAVELKDASGVWLNPGEGRDRAGYSYNIKMTVYGLEPIKITTTLTPWTYGGESSIDMQ